MCLRVTGVPEDAGILWALPTNGWSSAPAFKDGAPIEGGQAMTFTANGDTLNIKCRVATGDWNAVFEKRGADGLACTDTEKGAIAIGPAFENGGSTCVTASYNVPDSQVRLLVIDANGAEHVGQPRLTGGTKTFTQSTSAFDVAIDQIDRVILQSRPYNHIAEFKNITLDPAKKTRPEVNAIKP